MLDIFRNHFKFFKSLILALPILFAPIGQSSPEDKEFPYERHFSHKKNGGFPALMVLDEKIDSKTTSYEEALALLKQPNIQLLFRDTQATLSKLSNYYISQPTSQEKKVGQFLDETDNQIKNFY